LPKVALDSLFIFPDLTAFCCACKLNENVKQKNKGIKIFLISFSLKLDFISG